MSINIFLSKTAAIGAFALCIIGSVNAQALDIKGVAIGDSPEKVREALALNTNSSAEIIDTEIAGVSAMALPKYVDNKLTSLYIRYKSRDFETLRSALSDKYKKFACTNSVVKNAVGGSFDQVHCIISADNSTIVLRRFASDITNGSLSLVSKEESERVRQEQNTKKKDI